MNASFDCVQGSDGSKGEKGEVIFPGNPGSPGLRGKDVSKSRAQSDWYKKDGSVYICECVCVLCIIALRLLKIEGLLCHKIPIVCFLINASFILNYIFCFNGFQGVPGPKGEMGLRVRLNNNHRETHTFTQSLFLLFTSIFYILSYC